MRALLPCLILLVALGVLAPASASAMSFHDAVTDNYKASYNADPSQQELRSWFAIRGIDAAGTRWAPQPPTGAIQVVSAAAVTVRGADGRTATLATRVASGPASYLSMRIDPLHEESAGRWGPLIAISSTPALAAAPVRLTFTLTSAGGALLATGSVDYRYHAPFATAPAGSIEHNGPGGSWQPPNAGFTARPSVRRARITRIIAPRRTTRRSFRIRVKGRAGSRRITHVRFRVGSGRYTRWRRTTAKGYRVTLPRRSARHLLRVQLRDAGRRTSAVSSRRISCTCR